MSRRGTALSADRRRNRKLEEIEEEVADKEMPLKIYLPLHPEARLSAPDAERLIEWARSGRGTVEAGPAE